MARNNFGPNDDLNLANRLNSIYINDKQGQNIHCKLGKYRKIEAHPKHIKGLVEHINSK